MLLCLLSYPFSCSVSPILYSSSQLTLFPCRSPPGCPSNSSVVHCGAVYHRPIAHLTHNQVCLVLEFSAAWARHTFCSSQIPICFLLSEQGFPETVWEVTRVSGCAEAICVWQHISSGSQREQQAIGKKHWITCKNVRNDWTRCSGEQHGDASRFLVLGGRTEHPPHFEPFYFQNNGNKNVVKYLLPTGYHRDIATYHIAECSFLFNRTLLLQIIHNFVLLFSKLSTIF